jgi:hypothetical protein
VSPGWPNGETHQPVMRLGPLCKRWSEPGELKHLSTRRRRNQQVARPRGVGAIPRSGDHPSSGERNGAKPKPVSL